MSSKEILAIIIGSTGLGAIIKAVFDYFLGSGKRKAEISDINIDNATELSQIAMDTARAFKKDLDSVKAKLKKLEADYNILQKQLEKASSKNKQLQEENKALKKENNDLKDKLLDYGVQ